MPSTDPQIININDLYSFEPNYYGYTYLFGNVKNKIFLHIQKKLNYEICDIETPKNIHSTIKHLYINDNTIVIYSNESVYFYKNGQIVKQWNSPSSINSCKYVNENLFVCTKAGLHIQNINTGDTSWLFNGYNISDILYDRNGYLWISSLYDGILIIPSLNIIEYNKNYGKLNDNNIFCLHYDSISKTIFAGGNKGFFTSIHASGNIQFKKLSKDRILSISPYSERELIIGGDQFLGEIEKNLNQVHIINEKISLKYVKFIPPDLIYVGLSDQLVRGQIDKLNHTIYASKTLKFGRIYALHEDVDKDIWIGTSDGLYRKILNDSVIRIKQNISVSCITNQNDSIIWIGTLGNGIYKYLNKKLVEHLDVHSSLISTNVSCIQFDKFYRTWIGTNRGVQIMDSFGNTSLLLNNYNYLPNEETKSIAFDSANAWIGTMNGLVKIPMENIISDTSLPWFSLYSIQINSNTKNELNKHQFKYNENNLLFELSSLSYKNRGYEKYYYRLNPNDTTWNVNTFRTLRFTSLSPGNYALEIKNSNSSGFISGNPIKYYFEILKPWWQSLPFYLTLASLMLISILLFQNYQLKNIQNREKLKAEFQNQIDLLSNDALRSQMNPHFIYNTLNAIQDYILINDTKSAIEYLGKFANMTRMVFIHSASTYIKLFEELEFIKLYLEFEKLRFGEKVQIHFLIDPQLDNLLYQIKLPPLIAQPLIENAFKHGNLAKRNPGVLTIRYSLIENSILECIIEDNGVGNESIRLLGDRSPHDKNRSSIQIVLARMELYYRKYKDINIKYYDVCYLENNSGYRVTLKFPVYA